MPSITVRDLTIRYDEVLAVNNLALHVDEGEFLVLLGASGSGKTSTLRAIAGLERPSDGEITFGDRCMFSAPLAVDVPPARRGLGMVFQNYALYPHMTAMENVAFPLKTQRVPREKIALAVEQALALVDLTGLEQRYPRQLSGGQQQRVALARMLVGQPEVLLFDEPLSNVDAKLRVALRTDLKRLHRRFGATSLYVTHDVSEAFALADRIAIMFHGVIHQIGAAGDLYHRPETLQVAEMTGLPQTNLIPATVTRSNGQVLLAPQADPARPFPLPAMRGAFNGQRAVLNVRVEDLEIIGAGEAEGAGPLFEVFAVLPQGAATLIHLRFAGRREELVARVPRAAPAWRSGQPVHLRLRRGNLYDAATERLIDSFDCTAPPPNSA